LTRKLKPQSSLTVAKKQSPRWQRERNISLLIWIIIPLIIVSALGLVGYWGYDTYVTPWKQTIAKVNDTTIDMRYFVKMLRFYSWTSGATVDKISFPYQVLQVIEENELIRQAAPRFDITVSPDEVTERIVSYFVTEDEGTSAFEIVDVSPPPQGNETQGNETQGNATPAFEIVDASPLTEGEGSGALPDEDIDQLYQEWLDRVRLSDDEYRRIVETGLLGEKLSEYFKEHEVPEEAEHVHLHFIPLDSEEKAFEVSARLKNGEDFAALAEEFSIFEEIKEARGDIGWVPRGVYPELDEVAFELGAGNVSEPIPTAQGYYIVKVSETAESRPVEDAYLEILADRQFEKWLQKEREASIIKEYLDQDKINWAVDHM